MYSIIINLSDASRIKNHKISQEIRDLEIPYYANTSQIENFGGSRHTNDKDVMNSSFVKIVNDN